MAGLLEMSKINKFKFIIVLKMQWTCLKIFEYLNIIYFNMTSQYYKLMKLFLRKSAVWKKGDERFNKAILAWVRIKPSFSCTGAVCATDEPLHFQR
jgi:hypothetical protein